MNPTTNTPTFSLIPMGFEGEFNINEPNQWETLEDALDFIEDMGSRWCMYPFIFIVKGEVIVHPAEARGKTVKQVSKLFAEISEGDCEEEYDSLDYLHQLNKV